MQMEALRLLSLWIPAAFRGSHAAWRFLTYGWCWLPRMLFSVLIMMSAA